MYSTSNRLKSLPSNYSNRRSSLSQPHNFSTLVHPIIASSLLHFPYKYGLIISPKNLNQYWKLREERKWRELIIISCAWHCWSSAWWWQWRRHRAPQTWDRRIIYITHRTLTGIWEQQVLSALLGMPISLSHGAKNMAGLLSAVLLDLEAKIPVVDAWGYHIFNFLLIY